MPVLENIEAMTVNTPPAPPTEVDDPHQVQTVREITQTDHLNKRLLKSLLDSMKIATEVQDQDASSKTDADESDFDD